LQKIDAKIGAGRFHEATALCSPTWWSLKMTTKVFLSLSHTDADFVRQVQTRLPKGLAYFYETSFETGELLLKAMEKAVNDSAVFVLFASTAALKSWATQFEIDAARIVHLKNPRHRVLVFPTDSTFSFTQLPAWLQSLWIARAGYSANDVARYITNVLLEPESGLSNAAVRVVGRGRTLDKVERLTADFLSRHRRSPSIYVFAGFSGIGRRTFAPYYMRRALTAAVNLPFGPTIVLQQQTDLVDIYRGLRNEIEEKISPEKMARDIAAFSNAAQGDQVIEISGRIAYFAHLGQAVTLVSNSGFFEDRGDPKGWVGPLFSAIPADATLFVVCNRLFPPAFLDVVANAVQLRIDELDNADVKALMVFTAERLGVVDFKISDDLVRAIGGHADIANAAVRLAGIKGVAVLERDPYQLANIQNTILGEAIDPQALSKNEQLILCILGWVPSLGADLLERILTVAAKTNTEDFVRAIERLMLSCLITAAGHTYSISPAIRMLFRRFHISPPELLKAFAEVLSVEWHTAEENGQFRSDLFDAIVFMNALEGKQLPPELHPLLLPGTLNEVVRETYARGKDEDDNEKLKQAITWGEVARNMKMSEATREDILSTVVRAKIRLGQFESAEADIVAMSAKGYRSVFFLRGHMLRRMGNYSAAIQALEEAVREKKAIRSAVHELALCYMRTSKFEKLRALLLQHQGLMKDSAMFVDFQVGIDLARNDFAATATGIAQLKRMGDDDGRSGKREAQLMMRQLNYGGAKILLDRLMAASNRDRFRLRALRATAATRSGDFPQARRDIDFVKGMPGRASVGDRLEADLLATQGQFAAAEAIVAKLQNKGPEDFNLEARVLELKANSPLTPYGERQGLHDKANELRAAHRFALDHDYEE
jgi:tetratricopeptide (TPR) repeat protein